MAELKQFYYAEGKKNALVVTLDRLQDTLGCCIIPLPIIWNNNGLYGIICREKVENMIEVLQNQENLPTLNPIPKTGMFFWDEVEEMNQKTAKLLVGE